MRPTICTYSLVMAVPGDGPGTWEAVVGVGTCCAWASTNSIARTTAVAQAADLRCFVPGFTQGLLLCWLAYACWDRALIAGPALRPAPGYAYRGNHGKSSSAEQCQPQRGHSCTDETAYKGALQSGEGVSLALPLRQ